MKKLFFNGIALSVIIFGSSVAQAGNSIHCLDAGGYYGNIQAGKNSAGLIEIDAEQGFAFEISSQLGAPQGQEAYRYVILFNPQECASSPALIRCQGPAQVVSQKYSLPGSTFNANVSFKLVKTPDGHEAELIVQIPSLRKVGRASHRFIPSLGQCNW